MLPLLLLGDVHDNTPSHAKPRCNRFLHVRSSEYHPDNEPQYRVLLRRLGADAALAAGLSGPGIAA